MARIDKGALTKLEIITEATKQFLEKGYTNTSANAVAKALDMSQGNLTFHYPTKEHLLAILVDKLCDFQWKRMEQEANDGISSLDIIRKNDAKRAKEVFGSYRPDWTDEQFAEAEILVSGIEYATLMTAGDPVPLETRIAGALNNILGIYGVSEETRQIKLQKVFAMDYITLGKRVLDEFKQYVTDANDEAFQALIKR